METNDIKFSVLIKGAHSTILLRIPRTHGQKSTELKDTKQP
jgi:hypothetical protein